MAWLRSLVYSAVFYGLTVPIVILAVPIAFNPRLLKPYVHGWAHFHQWCARWLLGIRLKVEGTLPAEHVLVAAKHESAYETIALIGLLNEPVRSEEHTSELQSLMRISYAVFCLTKKTNITT